VTAVFVDRSAFLADPRRRRSAEVDFGVRWRNLAGPGLPWRVAWVEATGELYAAELGPGGPRRCVVLGRFPGQAGVEAFTAGWADRG
jgi:hypothetical protein